MPSITLKIPAQKVDELLHTPLVFRLEMHKMQVQEVIQTLLILDQYQQAVLLLEAPLQEVFLKL